jgi:spore coat polysaccharide biosynthesis protein SpsF
MKIGAVVQARLSSTRLPAKVLKYLPYGSDVTVLQQVIRRLKKSAKLNDIIIATTTDQADTKILRFTLDEGAKTYRGSVDNVLERYYLAAKEYDLDVIVRVTSDCPCIDPEVVDRVIDIHLGTHADYTSNTLTRTYPHGLDTEVLSFNTLEKAHLEAKQKFEREHVCPYIYRSNPQMFKISEVRAPERLHAPEIRITLDTEEDYSLLCAVFDYLYPKNEFFGVFEVIELFRDKPWLMAINKNVLHKKVIDSLEQELEEAVRLLDFQGLSRAQKILAAHLQ